MIGLRPRILLLTPYFLPCVKGGGSVRAVHHLLLHLGAAFDFVIATGDRDLDGPLDAAVCKAWRTDSGMDVRYLSYGPALIGQLRGLLNEHWDLIYLNSFLSLRFTALPLLLNRGRRPILLAPRGELLAGAMRQKPWRKRLYLRVLRGLGMLRGVHWHTTSAEETAQLHRLGFAATTEAADLPAPSTRTLPPPEPLAEGPLRVVYLSRIDEQKNLGFLLEALQQVRQPVQLEVLGPIVDHTYWRRCERLMAQLPSHVAATYRGAITPSEVDAALRQHELFALPTWGENHGYAIAEALAAGCLLLISDQTPWSALHQPPLIHALGLDRINEFANAIDLLANMSAAQRWQLRLQAQSAGIAALESSSSITKHQQMFASLIHSA